MKYQIGQLVIGKIVDVKPYAFLMSFEEGASGLLHISELSDSFILDIERFGSVGDEIKVVILSIDETNGFLRVSYKKVPKDQHYSSHVNKRSPLTVSNDEFAPLKEKLDDWIKDAYANIGKE